MNLCFSNTCLMHMPVQSNTKCGPAKWTEYRRVRGPGWVGAMEGQPSRRHTGLEEQNADTTDTQTCCRRATDKGLKRVQCCGTIGLGPTCCPTPLQSALTIHLHPYGRLSRQQTRYFIRRPSNFSCKLVDYLLKQGCICSGATAKQTTSKKCKALAMGINAHMLPCPAH